MEELLNFITSRKIINDVMGRLSRVLAVTVILPVYRGICIQAKEDGITLIVSDGTVSMKEIINEDITIYEMGECIVDGKLFQEIVKKMDDGDLSMRVEKNQLKIKGVLAEMKLVTFGEGIYPVIDFSFPKTDIRVMRNHLVEAIEKTIFSSSEHQTRPILGGLHFKTRETQCEVTGTDSYRLSQMKIPAICSNELEITIPKKMLSLISGIFTEEEVILRFDQHKALLASGNLVIQSVLLDGRYPNTDQLLPKYFDTEITLDTETLLRALDRTSFNKEDGVTIIGIELLDDGIVITSESKEIGSSTEEISVIDVIGNYKVKFFCNQQYILDAVKAIGEQQCILHFNSDCKPFLLTGCRGSKQLQLLLPMKHY